jgi:hypothetical protein
LSFQLFASNPSAQTSQDCANEGDELRMGEARWPDRLDVKGGCVRSCNGGIESLLAVTAAILAVFKGVRVQGNEGRCKVMLREGEWRGKGRAAASGSLSRVQLAPGPRASTRTADGALKGALRSRLALTLRGRQLDTLRKQPKDAGKASVPTLLKQELRAEQDMTAARKPLGLLVSGFDGRFAGALSLFSVLMQRGRGCTTAAIGKIRRVSPAPHPLLFRDLEPPAALFESDACDSSTPMHPFEECLKLSLGPCMPAATAVLFCLALGAVSGAAP